MRISDWSSDVGSSDLRGSKAVVMLDGGIRRGSDVIKAMALGAKAVLIGRPGMFALSYGEAGVRQMLEILSADLRRTLQAMGCEDVAMLNPSYLRRSEEHTSELQSLMRISYAVFCLKT